MWNVYNTFRNLNTLGFKTLCTENENMFSNSKDLQMNFIVSLHLIYNVKSISIKNSVETIK